MYRRAIARTLVLVLAATLVWSTGAALAAGAPVELRFMSWYFGEEPAATALRKLLADYQKGHASVKIIEENVTSAERVQKFVTQMEGNQGPDIYMDTEVNAPFEISKGFCRDLDAYISKDSEKVRERFAKGLLEGFSEKGRLYFMPYAVGPTALVYNAKMWQAAGLDPNKPPKTWEELRDYAVKLTKGGKYGVGLFGKGDGSSIWRLSYWWLSNGASVLSPDGKHAAINTPAFKEAMTFWSELFTKYKVSPPSTPQNSFGENNALFASQTVAIVQSGVWQFGVTHKMNPQLQGELRVAPMPLRKVAVAAGGGDDALCITTQSKHPDEAYDLLKFLTTAPNGVTVWKIHGKFPSNLQALKSPELQADPMVKAWAPILPLSKAPVISTKTPEIYQILGVMQQQILLGTKSVNDAVAEASQKIDETMQK